MINSTDSTTRNPEDSLRANGSRCWYIPNRNAGLSFAHGDDFSRKSKTPFTRTNQVVPTDLPCDRIHKYLTLDPTVRGLVFSLPLPKCFSSHFNDSIVNRRRAPPPPSCVLTMMSDSPGRVGCYVAAIVLLVFSTATVGLRLRVRSIKRSYLGLDDLFISISLLFVWALAIILIVAAAKGTIGVRVSSVHNEILGSKFAFISQVLSTIVYGTVKLGVLFLFRRIFHGKTFDIISFSAIALVVASSAALFFATLFQCGPNLADLWTGPNAPAGHCGPTRSVQLGHAVSDVVTGLLVLIIPVPMIWKLHMSLAQKTGIMAVFMLGYMSVAVASHVVDSNPFALETNIMVWSYVEAAIGIIAASLPTLTPLLQGHMEEDGMRSRISLTSTRSQKKGGEISETNTWSYEMPNRDIYGQSSSQLTTRIEREMTRNFAVKIPGGRILRQDNVVVQEDRI
ncbi:hypothetical protein HYFRA_00010500 [Hymenoscyphus fraxineus]|uniref:Rhodopsin domain-containing protein n=1 Tax=Hymenoscyphus fraxineus TaxID=746836 RepID=A0A9N9L3U0_9HELO|nr:hypothetical protein HYFRA_00010500 [Hymenoscyphus fraxineus]